MADMGDEDSDNEFFSVTPSKEASLPKKPLVRKYYSPPREKVTYDYKFDSSSEEEEEKKQVTKKKTKPIKKETVPEIEDVSSIQLPVWAPAPPPKKIEPPPQNNPVPGQYPPGPNSYMGMMGYGGTPAPVNAPMQGMIMPPMGVLPVGGPSPSVPMAMPGNAMPPPNQAMANNPMAMFNAAAVPNMVNLMSAIANSMGPAAGILNPPAQNNTNIMPSSFGPLASGPNNVMNTFNNTNPNNVMNPFPPMNMPSNNAMNMGLQQMNMPPQQNNMMNPMANNNNMVNNMQSAMGGPLNNALNMPFNNPMQMNSNMPMPNLPFQNPGQMNMQNTMQNNMNQQNVPGNWQGNLGNMPMNNPPQMFNQPGMNQGNNFPPQFNTMNDPNGPNQMGPFNNNFNNGPNQMGPFNNNNFNNGPNQMEPFNNNFNNGPNQMGPFNNNFNNGPNPMGPFNNGPNQMGPFNNGPNQMEPFNNGPNQIEPFNNNFNNGPNQMEMRGPRPGMPPRMRGPGPRPPFNPRSPQDFGPKQRPFRPRLSPRTPYPSVRPSRWNNTEEPHNSTRVKIEQTVSSPAVISKPPVVTKVDGDKIISKGPVLHKTTPAPTDQSSKVSNVSTDTAASSASTPTIPSIATAIIATTSEDRKRPAPPVTNPVTGFKNDGSFFEMFKKMKEGDGPEEAASSSTKDSTSEDSQKPKPTPNLIGKRRGGRVLKTGMVEKVKKPAEEEDKSPKDAWALYMAEVKKYREHNCEEDGKTRALVK